MTIPPGGYTFLPWLRIGVANTIATADGDASVLTRATIDVQLDIDGERADGSHLRSRLIARCRSWGLATSSALIHGRLSALIHVSGSPTSSPSISRRSSSTTRIFPGATRRPRPTIGTASPAAVARAGRARGRRVRRRGANADTAACRAIALANAALFPPADELWAWAHVHVNAVAGRREQRILARISTARCARCSATLNENADLAYSRIRLPAPARAGHGVSRLRGSGVRDAAGSPASATIRLSPARHRHAWDVYPARPDPDIIRVYYRWFFRTGAIGDFEYLVRLLQPRPVDARVGTRDMDVLDPGANLPGDR